MLIVTLRQTTGDTFQNVGALTKHQQSAFCLLFTMVFNHQLTLLSSLFTNGYELNPPPTGVGTAASLQAVVAEDKRHFNEDYKKLEEAMSVGGWFNNDA